MNTKDELFMLMRHCQTDPRYLEYLLSDYMRMREDNTRSYIEGALKEINMFLRQVCDLKRNRPLLEQMLEELDKDERK